MEIKPGDKLGRYQLVSPIGEGGMGEVWKARDTQLHRDVALKVSRAAFTARFDREARVISAGVKIDQYFEQRRPGNLEPSPITRSSQGCRSQVVKDSPFAADFVDCLFA